MKKSLGLVWMVLGMALISCGKKKDDPQAQVTAANCKGDLSICLAQVHQSPLSFHITTPKVGAVEYHVDSNSQTWGLTTDRFVLTCTTPTLCTSDDAAIVVHADSDVRIIEWQVPNVGPIDGSTYSVYAKKGVQNGSSITFQLMN